MYLISRGYQATEIGTGEAAAAFVAWLASGANAALTRLIQTWLALPPDAGGLGALAESPQEIAALRAEITRAWQASGGQVTR